MSSDDYSFNTSDEEFLPTYDQIYKNSDDTSIEQDQNQNAQSHYIPADYENINHQASVIHGLEDNGGNNNNFNLISTDNESSLQEHLLYLDIDLDNQFGNSTNFGVENNGQVQAGQSGRQMHGSQTETSQQETSCRGTWCSVQTSTTGNQPVNSATGGYQSLPGIIDNLEERGSGSECSLEGGLTETQLQMMYEVEDVELLNLQNHEILREVNSL